MPITGEVTVNGFTFKYGEIAYGTGRGIRIACDGNCTNYMIKPNPHDDSFYNKKTAQWYLKCATSFGGNYTVPAGNDVAAQLNWPVGDAGAEVNNVDYELQVR